jgi:hypothetical protein
MPTIKQAKEWGVKLEVVEISQQLYCKLFPFLPLLFNCIVRLAFVFSLINSKVYNYAMER